MPSNRLLTATAILLATFSPATLAYLDPGTGSMIISAIVGLLASLALAVKTYWYRLTGILRRAFRGGRPAIDQNENGSLKNDSQADDYRQN